MIDLLLIHGAYESIGIWKRIVTSVEIKQEININTLEIPGLRNKECYNSWITRLIRKYDIESERQLVVVGHSLGAAIACEFVLNLESRNNISLLISCMPVKLPFIVIKSREIIELFIISIFSRIPKVLIPNFLIPKVYTVYRSEQILRKLLHTHEYIDLLALQKNKIRNISFGYSKNDPLCGRQKKYKYLVEKLKNKEINAIFFDFGMSFHYPYLLSQKKFKTWIFSALGERRFER